VQLIDYIGFICLCMNALQKFFVIMSMNHGVSRACTDLHMNLCTIHGNRTSLNCNIINFERFLNGTLERNTSFLQWFKIVKPLVLQWYSF
jgi:hypothetical protein